MIFQDRIVQIGHTAMQGDHLITQLLLNFIYLNASGVTKKTGKVYATIVIIYWSTRTKHVIMSHGISKARYI